MRDALNATGRAIFFAACEWAVDFPSTWMRPVANTWRTTYDIQNYWECVVPHVDWQNVFADYYVRPRTRPPAHRNRAPNTLNTQPP